MGAALAGAIERLVGTFAPERIYVFGSQERGTARPDSDIDLLVEFDRPVSLFEFARLRGHLQDLLGRPVDLCHARGAEAAVARPHSS